MSRAAAVDAESSGNPILDSILGGGIPSLATVIVAGQPGSGKTVFTLQTLFAAAKRGKKCLYFTTVSEPAIKVLRYMQRFSFFDPTLFEKNIIFADLGVAIRSGAQASLDTIAKWVEREEPAFVAIDSFRAIGDLSRGNDDLRHLVYDLSVQTAGWSATTLLVGEYAQEDTTVRPEFAVADGIIYLSTERRDLTAVREIEVLKMRGAAYSSGRHFYEITPGGLAFYPRVGAPPEAPDPPELAGERVATGVSGLDELLGGGLPRGSTTMLQGATGTGKTLLALQYLMAGIARGERGVLFTLEETADQLRWIGRNMRWDIAAAEASRKLVIKYTSPVELSTDRFLYQARTEVESLGARRAVFDSLTTMALGVPSERRFKEMVYAVSKHMRAIGVSALFTVELPQTMGAPALTGGGASFIADNLIQLRYVELGGRLERALSVIKARGIRHSTELRAVHISEAGVNVVSGRFKDLRGVLTGTPERESRSDR